MTFPAISTLPLWPSAVMPKRRYTKPSWKIIGFTCLCGREAANELCTLPDVLHKELRRIGARFEILSRVGQKFGRIVD